MLRMQVYLPEELFSNLKSRAAIEDISMSEIIRKCLEGLLFNKSAKTDPMKEFVGKFKSKKKTNGVKEINNYYKNILK